MADWSESHFLQSLGWATINSFWQMALLWCIYLGANALKLTAHRKYQFSVLAIGLGFGWFLFTFFTAFQNPSVTTLALFSQPIRQTDSLLNICLISASLAYLILLFIPSYRLLRNFRFVQRIRKEGIRKADLGYRLFVQKIAAQLGIRKKVWVYLSELVKSPVTVGYLKPVILLPMAALNNLSTQQVEAILLHELSHIRRYDYLVNLVISVINTILYFNPFVKQFMKNIEEERENCCDQLVLQFGYDKVGYATALLTLEKLSVQHRVLALGATGKNYLLSRIEKIVGMEKKKGFKRNQLAGILAALFCIVVFNSILIIRDKKVANYPFLNQEMAAASFSIFDNNIPSGLHSTTPYTHGKGDYMVKSDAASPILQPSKVIPDFTGMEQTEWSQDLSLTGQPGMMPVALDEIDARLTPTEKLEVKKTLEATKSLVNNLQWKQAETAIADVLTEKEKLLAKQEFAKAINKTIDWKVMEESMKAQYEKMDWEKINTNLNTAIVSFKLDSMEKKYKAILVEMDKLKTVACAQGKVAETAMPDGSVEELKRSREELQRRVETIQAIKQPKKVVKL